MSLPTALIPYKSTAQFVAEQAMNEQQIMNWERCVSRRFYTEGHLALGQITAAKKTAAIVVRLFEGHLFPPVAKLVTHYIGYDYGDGYDFYFFRILPDGMAQFRVVEAIDLGKDWNVMFGATLLDEFGYELLHSEAFEAEQAAKDAADAGRRAAWRDLLEPL